MPHRAHDLTLLIDDVTVLRGGEAILAGASARLAPGDALILTGANGSGKTSLLRAIAGFSRYEGAIAVSGPGGPRLAPEDAALALHYVGHESGLNRRQDARAHIAFWQRLLGATPAIAPAAVIARMDLPTGPVWRFSAGQQRRLSLARLVAVPRAIWLLDEPLTALDAAGRALVAALCAEHRAAGGIVIATSHGPIELPGAHALALSRPVTA